MGTPSASGGGPPRPCGVLEAGGKAPISGRILPRAGIALMLFLAGALLLRPPGTPATLLLMLLGIVAAATAHEPSHWCAFRLRGHRARVSWDNSCVWSLAPARKRDFEMALFAPLAPTAILWAAAIWLAPTIGRLWGRSAAILVVVAATLVILMGGLDIRWWRGIRRCPGGAAGATFQSREDRKADVCPPPGGCPWQPECPLARRLSEQTRPGKEEGWE